MASVLSLLERNIHYADPPLPSADYPSLDPLGRFDKRSGPTTLLTSCNERTRWSPVVEMEGHGYQVTPTLPCLTGHSAAYVALFGTTDCQEACP